MTNDVEEVFAATVATGIGSAIALLVVVLWLALLAKALRSTVAAEIRRDFPQRPGAPMTDSPDLHVVGTTGKRSCGTRSHATGLVLDSDVRLDEVSAIALIDAGRVLYMIPPPGAPARAAYEATGLFLILQVTECPDCGRRVLFAGACDSGQWVRSTCGRLSWRPTSSGSDARSLPLRDLAIDHDAGDEDAVR